MNSMIDEDGKVKAYTQEFSSLLNKNINVLYTGDNAVCDGISEKSFQSAKNIYNRNLGIWWNYPVNDYYIVNGKKNIKLALGPIEKLPKIKPNSIFYNPMQQPILSKISLGTGADYALSTSTYNPIISWNKIIEKQFGNLAHPMKIFASHSQHMEFSSAKCGPPDAPEFYEIAHQAILEIKKGKNYDFTELNEMIDDMIDSVIILLEKLPNNILKESQSNLEQFHRIAIADLIAVHSLKKNKMDSELKNLRKEIKDNESNGIISEFSAVLFIDEVIQFFEQKK
jgi:hyaluronoglucosaminidase